MSAQQLITEHIDLWTSTIKAKKTQGRGSSKKRELYGIKKLRELILELAVRGKLVPQNPSDEPASVLLERIAVEKEQLVEDKKIRKQKPLPEITDEEKPFDQPTGWEWVRFQAVAAYIQRGKGPNYADSGDVQVVSQKCIQWTGFDLEPARYVEDSSLGKYQEERFLQSGDLLWNSTGTGTVGRINLLDYAEEKTLVADSHVTVIRPLIVNGGFLQAYISAPGVQSRIEPGHENALVSGSTNQVELNTSSVLALPIPVPSINEQHRIVAKVDELMALCDQLEQQTEFSLDAHNLLVDTLLPTLADARDANELSDNWARLADHFDTLITTDYAVEQLKQTILQLAVQGKLAPQDPNDEPACELLKRIAVRKVQLIKDKKIKKQKPLSEVTDKEKPFELPDGWEWCRFDALAQLVTSGSRGWKAFYSDSGSTFIRSQDIKKDKLEFDNRSFVDLPKTTEGVRTKVECNDLLMTITGANVAKVARIEDVLVDSYVSQHVALIRLVEGSLGKYLHIWLTGEHGGRKLLLNSSYGAKPGLNLLNIRELVIPVAPVEEGHRIIAKVDKLMALCDKLKAQLNDAQSIQIHLSDAVVEDALSA